MQRVARPGGRLLVLDFGRPNNAVWRGIYFAYLRNFVPLLGRIFCGDADTHGYILNPSCITQRNAAWKPG